MSEGEAAVHSPALSLEAVQWEQLRVDQALIAFVSATAAKITQLDKSVMDTSALYRGALSKANELEEECARLRLHGEWSILKYRNNALAADCFSVSEVDANIARLRQNISENDVLHKQAVDAMQSQHVTSMNTMRKQLKEVCSDQSVSAIV